MAEHRLSYSTAETVGFGMPIAQMWQELRWRFSSRPQKQYGVLVLG